LTFNGLQGVISQKKVVLFITTAVRTSNPTRTEELVFMAQLTSCGDDVGEVDVTVEWLALLRVRQASGAISARTQAILIKVFRGFTESF
jgi:hypothetical protein